MGSVFLDNVDDYLAPSQACINPLFTSDRRSNPSEKSKSEKEKGKKEKDETDSDDGAAAAAAATKVRPRRMRVVRRQSASGGGSIASRRQSSTVSNGSIGTTSNGDAMDIDNAGRVDLAVAGRKRPPRQPIALTYQTHDDATNDGDFTTVSAAASATSAAAVPKQQKATVSVADCLACSGCVTSAEAVMVQSHSVSTLREYVATNFKFNVSQNDKNDKKDNKKEAAAAVVVVFTISPASLSDLIRHLYMSRDGSSNGSSNGSGGSGGKQFPSPDEVLGRIATFLHEEFHASMVIDGTLVQQLSLIESAEEFCTRYNGMAAVVRKTKKDVGMAVDMDDYGVNGRNGSASNTTTDFPMSTPSIALSSTETRFLVQKSDTDNGGGGNGIGGIGNSKSTTEGIVVQHEPGRDARLYQPDVMATSSSPVVTSSCPGFVCYVEKTAPAVIPHLSTAKSPMACSGTLVKHIMASPVSSLQSQSQNGENTAVPAAKIYHVAIMPCHDKKLEAGRKDLAWESGDGGGDGDTEPDVDLVLTTSELLTLLSDAAAVDSASSSNVETGSIGLPSVGDEMDVDTKNIGVDAVRSFLERVAITEPTDRMENTLGATGGVILLAPMDSTVAADSATGQTETVRMIGSGAYAEFCFRYAARRLFEYNIADETPLPWKRVTRGGTVQEGSTNSAPAPIRRRRAARGGSVAHSDMAEVVLYRLADGSFSLQPQVFDGLQPQPVLKFATAYGFKNVQLVLMKLGKRGEASGDIAAAHSPEYYDFIEVMACPSGCLNGGGQIRDDEKGARRETPVETRQRVGQNRSVMNAIGLRTSVDHSASSSNVVSTAYRGESESDRQAPLSSGPFGSEARKLLHTRFHVVPKLELSTGATAGVAIDDTVW